MFIGRSSCGEAHALLFSLHLMSLTTCMYSVVWCALNELKHAEIFCKGFRNQKLRVGRGD